MKKLFVFLFIALVIFGVIGPTEATLIDNLDGTVTQIRNDGSRLMWLKIANYAYTSGYDNDGLLTWEEANIWINHLNSLTHLEYNDWRLPATLPVNGSNYNHNITYDGSSDEGYNITSLNSEMAYMFYVEMGLPGYFDTNGNPTGSQGEIHFYDGPFEWVEAGIGYWSGSEFPGSSNQKWYFNFNIGEQGGTFQDYAYAWAVRDIAPVPEPATILLLGTGLVGLIGFGRRKFRK